MQSARRERLVDRFGGHEARRLDRLSSPSRRSRRAPLGRSGPSPIDHGAQLGQRRSGPAGSRRRSRARASPGCAGPRTPPRGCRGLGLGRVERSPAYSPSSTVTSPRRPPAPQPVAVEAREAERALRHAHAQRLDRLADRAADAAEVLAPVLAAPDLVPVHHQPVAAEPPQQAGRQQREVREGSRVDDVVRAPVAQQVRTARRRRTRAAAGSAAGRPAVEAIRGPTADHVARRRSEASVPASHWRSVRYVTSGRRREPLGEVAIPALGAADGPREQAVVDDADPHAAAKAGRRSLHRASSVRRSGCLCVSYLVALLVSVGNRRASARHEHDPENPERRVACAGRGGSSSSRS